MFSALFFFFFQIILKCLTPQNYIIFMNMENLNTQSYQLVKRQNVQEKGDKKQDIIKTF